MAEIKIIGNFSESGLKEQDIKEAVEATFQVSGREKNVNIAFVDSGEIQHKNKKYRGKDFSTDILSFDYGDEGDIMIALADIDRLKEKSESLAEATQKTIIHGVLHLFGLDHENEEDRDIMNEKEMKVFERLKQ